MKSSNSCSTLSLKKKEEEQPTEKALQKDSDNKVKHTKLRDFVLSYSYKKILFAHKMMF